MKKLLYLFLLLSTISQIEPAPKRGKRGSKKGTPGKMKKGSGRQSHQGKSSASSRSTGGIAIPSGHSTIRQTSKLKPASSIDQTTTPNKKEPESTKTINQNQIERSDEEAQKYAESQKIAYAYKEYLENIKTTLQDISNLQISYERTKIFFQPPTNEIPLTEIKKSVENFKIDTKYIENTITKITTFEADAVDKNTKEEITKLIEEQKKLLQEEIFKIFKIKDKEDNNDENLYLEYFKKNIDSIKQFDIQKEKDTVIKKIINTINSIFIKSDKLINIIFDTPKNTIQKSLEKNDSKVFNKQNTKDDFKVQKKEPDLWKKRDDFDLRHKEESLEQKDKTKITTELTQSYILELKKYTNYVKKITTKSKQIAPKQKNTMMNGTTENEYYYVIDEKKITARSIYSNILDALSQLKRNDISIDIKKELIDALGEKPQYFEDSICNRFITQITDIANELVPKIKEAQKKAKNKQQEKTQTGTRYIPAKDEGTLKEVDKLMKEFTKKINDVIAGLSQYKVTDVRIFFGYQETKSAKKKRKEEEATKRKEEEATKKKQKKNSDTSGQLEQKKEHQEQESTKKTEMTNEPKKEKEKEEVTVVEPEEKKNAEESTEKTEMANEHKKEKEEAAEVPKPIEE